MPYKQLWDGNIKVSLYPQGSSTEPSFPAAKLTPRKTCKKCSHWMYLDTLHKTHKCPICGYLDIRKIHIDPAMAESYLHANYDLREGQSE